MRLLYDPYVDSSGERMGICVRRKGLTASEALVLGFADVRSTPVGVADSDEVVALAFFEGGSGIGVFLTGPLTVTNRGRGFGEDLFRPPALLCWERVTFFGGRALSSAGLIGSTASASGSLSSSLSAWKSVSLSDSRLFLRVWAFLTGDGGARASSKASSAAIDAASAASFSVA
jgi:hypothetical protein